MLPLHLVTSMKTCSMPVRQQQSAGRHQRDPSICILSLRQVCELCVCGESRISSLFTVMYASTKLKVVYNSRLPATVRAIKFVFGHLPLLFKS